MTRDDAKRILLAYRPGSSDEDDPEVAQALARSKEDPELRDWLDDHCAFQNTFRSQLRELSLPPGLRDRILAQPKIVVPLWRRPEVLLAAACLVVGLVIAALLTEGKANERTLALFRSRMVGFALRVYRMDIETNDLNQVRAYLRSQGAPADYAVASGLQTRPVKGGAKLSWQGHPVSMVCFNLSEKQTLYMFVMESAAIPQRQRPGATPVLSAVRGVLTAVWTRDDKVYLIAGARDSDELQKLIAGHQG